MIDAVLDLIVDIVESGPSFDSVMPVLGLYIFLVWVMFSAWVYKDAKERYENRYAALGFLFLILPFNFPALVFYLIVRPETEDELIGHMGHLEHGIGGVNVPVINFTGKNGEIEMSLVLKINGSVENTKNTMKVNVDFQPSEPVFVKEEIKKTADIDVQKQDDTKKTQQAENNKKIDLSRAKVKFKNVALKPKHFVNKIRIKDKSAENKDDKTVQTKTKNDNAGSVNPDEKIEEKK